ncbi:MAG: hypothetical protein ABIH86_00135 [Planctomycetota bacterium]
MSNEYDWRTDQRLDRWKLDGFGELEQTDDGELLVRTFDCGPNRRATNIWLKDIELSDNFEIEWTFRSKAPAGNVMIIFNAKPLALNDLFDDPRPHARYSDLASYRKMICHTCGFHRGVYQKDSVLRKLGGNVPTGWGEALWGTPSWEEMNTKTTLHSTREPLTSDSLGSEQSYRLTRNENRIVVAMNGAVLHDVVDSGQYPFYPDPLRGGGVGFRNFGGYAEDFYSHITIRSI